MMTVFYIFVSLTFLFIVLLLILSWVLFHRIDTCLDVAETAKAFHYRALNSIQDLAKKVSEYKDISETTKFNQEELEKAFDDLKETATELQAAHKTKRAVLDLMRR